MDIVRDKGLAVIHLNNRMTASLDTQFIASMDLGANIAVTVRNFCKAGSNIKGGEGTCCAQHAFAIVVQ